MKIILLFALILSSCTFSAAPTIDPNEIYQGYPCGNRCASFQTGFDQARKENLQSNLECATFPSDQIIGCQAAVIETIRGREEFTDLSIE